MNSAILPGFTFSDRDGPPDQRHGYYYVSVRDAGRIGLLLGPYPTHAEAIERVAIGREHAERAVPRAAFYSFGTSRLPADYPRAIPRGVLHAAFPELD